MSNIIVTPNNIHRTWYKLKHTYTRGLAMNSRGIDSDECLQSAYRDIESVFNELERHSCYIPEDILTDLKEYGIHIKNGASKAYAVYVEIENSQGVFKRFQCA